MMPIPARPLTPVYQHVDGQILCCGKAISQDRAEAYLIAHRKSEADCLAAGDLMVAEHADAKSLADELDAAIALAVGHRVAAILTGLAEDLDAVRAVLSGHLAGLQDQHRAAGRNVIPFSRRS